MVYSSNVFAHPTDTASESAHNIMFPNYLPSLHTPPYHNSKQHANVGHFVGKEEEREGGRGGEL